MSDRTYPKNVIGKLVSDDGSHAYGRPTAGNNAPLDGGPDGGLGLGPPATDADAPPGVQPANPYVVNMLGNQFPNPDISGAAIVAPVAQPDATGHPADAAGTPGTVGDSGPGLGQ